MPKANDVSIGWAVREEIEENTELSSDRAPINIEAASRVCTIWTAAESIMCVTNVNSNRFKTHQTK